MNTTWDAQDSPGYRVIVPISSNSPAGRVTLGRTVASFAFSGSPQLAKASAITKANQDRAMTLILLIGFAGLEQSSYGSLPVLHKLFAVPGNFVQNSFCFRTPDHNGLPVTRQVEAKILVFFIILVGTPFVTD